ncbi:MAG TPA: antibiotic biosynthesis monooxygenase family protein [Acidimicrobiales bacterium]|nr:antibiotic biosynthesis monooxygenase family protein [Acidimicrobiales bacterium]
MAPVAPEPDPGIELTVVTLVFDAKNGDAGAAERLLGVLSKYVVLSRSHPGCRNIDLCGSVTAPGRYLVIQKWDSPASQRAHFDSPHMVEMAKACEGLLERRPEIDLFEGISAHDLN